MIAPIFSPHRPMDLLIPSENYCLYCTKLLNTASKVFLDLPSVYISILIVSLYFMLHKVLLFLEMP